MSVSTSHMSSSPVPTSPSGATETVLTLIEQARLCLAEAASATHATDRYALAHLGALRAAAAVLAACATPGARRGTPRSAWDLLSELAPELQEWATHFAQGASRRAAAEAGLSTAVSTRQADDLLRDSDAFLGLVCHRLGLPPRQSFVTTRAIVAR